MTNMFGVPMNSIMYALVFLLVISVSTLVFIYLRNRVLFRLGIRNIPRRRAQTTLIVLGLMLSTLIISAAFTTGDTVQRSITGEVYGLLGSVDEVILVRGVGEVQNDEDEAFGGDQDVVARQMTFPATMANDLLPKLRSIPNVDYVLPTYTDIATGVNLDKKQSSPLFNVVGLDAASSKGLGDLQTTGGQHVEVADLGTDEIYIDKAAAQELDVKVGETVTLYTQGKQRGFKVKAILKDTRLTGASGVGDRRRGGVLPLATAQELFNAPGMLTFVVISNKGGDRDGLEFSSAVTAQARQDLRDLGLTARPTAGQPQLILTPIKRAAVDGAETGASVLTTFFLVLGLFSIGAGVLLIFMIFVMLAAERKAEMGMARAVGTKRLDLVQIFLAEGMGYNLLAAMVGTGLGVLVSFAISRIMAALFASFDVSISPYVTPRTMIISYALGVVLTFLTVTFSSWRVSQINIVRAIRDIPEPPPEKPMWKAHGFIATVGGLIFKSGNGQKLWGSGRRWYVLLPLFVLRIVLLPLTAGIYAMSGLWNPTANVPWWRRLGMLFFGVNLAFGLGSVGGIVAILGAAIGFILIAGFVFVSFKPGPLFVIAGIPLIVLGSSSGSAFALLFGLSLVPLGLALTFRSFGSNERWTYTITGLLMLYVWEFDFSVGLINKIFGETDGDIEMFFLSGVMVTIAATFVVVYNADLILGPLTRLGSVLGALLPSIKMAVAYPLSNRVRTGMTMAMFCLVVFALTVISSMNYNFNRLFISDRALGGWDVIVDENPTNPIGDLKARLTDVQSPAVASIQNVGQSGIVGPRNGRVCQTGVEGDSCDPNTPDMSKAGFTNYQVRGEDDGFLTTAKVALQTRAKGYETDADVWRAVQQSDKFAVVDANALPGGGFGSAGFLHGVTDQANDMDPIPLIVVDQRTRKSTTVQIIGIVELGASNTYSGLHVKQSVIDDVFGKPDLRRYFIKTTSGSDNVAVARDIEASLLTTGAQADSLRRKVDEQNATFQGFFYLMQGFMGLGLFVGVAAVGVIAFRTVVERRQQIGMLRAIGYTKGMIGLTFLIESSFIAFMGVLSGVVFALILARQLITEAFQNQGVTSFAVPWPQVLIIAGLAYGFATLITLIPSRQAASIPIAEALRYE